MKRRSERNDEMSRKRKNPFLELQKRAFPNTANDDQNQVLLDHVLSFSEASRQAHKNKDESIELVESVTYLLEYLERHEEPRAVENSSAAVSLLSRSDIATMLLQWAVKKLVFVSTNSKANNSKESLLMYWKTLKVCLVVLTARNEAGGCAINLSQSMLNKLVPFAARTALAERQDTDAATCYAVLLEESYRPTMDSACHSLLPLVDDLVTKNASKLDDGSRFMLATSSHLTILESTVKLLQRLQGTCNPKKMFQLLAEPRVLSSLARWRLAAVATDGGEETSSIEATVRELLEQGLFAPSHHIDGFRSMVVSVPVLNQSVDDGKPEANKHDDASKKKSFHCYQETLLQSVTSLIGVDSSNTDNPSSPSNDSIVPTALLVPGLVNGLIEMFASWQRDSLAKMQMKKKGGRDLAPVQFRLWTNFVHPLIQRIRTKDCADEESSTMLLRSLRESLSLVLKHNLYLQSHKDDNNVSFSFLESLAVLLLNIHFEMTNDLESQASLLVASECLLGLETLLRLNHLVLHDRLPSLITACGRDVSLILAETSGSLQEYPRNLMLVIIQTYSRLRQLDHLFRSFLMATDDLQEQDVGNAMNEHHLAGDTLVALKRMLLESEIRQEFAKTILNCPPSQTKDLFGILNVWIHERATQVGVLDSADLSLVVSLFVLLIKNVRVDEHTASTAAALCNDSITKAVYPLIEGSTKVKATDEGLKREGLVLTGWLVELKNRCAFWLDESQETGEKNANELENVPAILEASGLAKILADDEFTSESISRSMSHAVQFLLLHRIRELHTVIFEAQRAELTGPRNDRSASSPMEEARRLVSIVFSIVESDTTSSKDSSLVSTSLWKQLAETISYWAPYSEPIHVEAFLSWLFVALSSCIAEERAVAEALLRDATFFEIPELATHFHQVGIGCAMNLASQAVAKKSNDGMPPGFAGFNWTSTSADQLDQAAIIIRVLNGVPLARSAATVDQEEPSVFDQILPLDGLACGLFIKARSDTHIKQRAMYPLLCAVRTFMAKSLAGDTNNIAIEKGLAVFIYGLVKASRDAIRATTLDDMGQFMRASEKIVESLFAACLSNSKDQRELTRIVDYFQNFLTSMNNEDEGACQVLMSMCRVLVKRMNIHFQHNSFDGFDLLLELVSSVQDSFGGALDDSLLQNESLRAEWLLLVGDTARFVSLVDPDSGDSYAKNLSAVRSSLASSNKSIKRAGLYALASFVASNQFSSPIVDLVVGECLTSPNQLLDATFCRLVGAMQASDICGLLERVLKEARNSPDHKQYALRLFQLMLEHVGGEASRLEIAKVARSVYAMSFELLRPFDGTDLSSWVNQCSLGTSLLVALTENKDIITIRERDLGIILVQVVSLLGKGGSYRKPNEDAVDGRAYSSCFTLVSSLLQRFPKQLYACAPTVSLTMHAMLKHVLYGALEEQEIASRSQMFTRLCELIVPHRDVYKKHVLSLILEYVSALKSGIHSSRSKALVPSMYCLLDMLSQFETDQLNTMMDTTAKALFRSIYQTHQKTHMYKGQY